MDAAGVDRQHQPFQPSRKALHVKLIALTLALSLAATTAFAGGAVEPIMEETVVAANTASSAGGTIVPLLLLLVVAAAVAGRSGGGPVDVCGKLARC